MTHSLTTDYAENNSNQTLNVHVVVENVVSHMFFFLSTVYFCDAVSTICSALHGDVLSIYFSVGTSGPFRHTAHVNTVAVCNMCLLCVVCTYLTTERHVICIIGKHLCYHRVNTSHQNCSHR